MTDPIHNPAHYTVYPVQPIQITRHLGFCLGNATKYVLRAPYKGGVEDCDKALEYLRLENSAPQPPLSYFAFLDTSQALRKLERFLRESGGDLLWQDISSWQASFLDSLAGYLRGCGCSREFGTVTSWSCLADDIRELRRVLGLRDTTGQIYEGMSGLPEGDGE